MEYRTLFKEPTLRVIAQHCSIGRLEWLMWGKDRFISFRWGCCRSVVVHCCDNNFCMFGAGPRRVGVVHFTLDEVRAQLARQDSEKEEALDLRITKRN